MQSRFVPRWRLGEINQARFRRAVQGNAGHVAVMSSQEKFLTGQTRSYPEMQARKNAININCCHISSVFGLTALIRETYFCHICCFFFILPSILHDLCICAYLTHIVLSPFGSPAWKLMLVVPC